jgi:hypothetical protein
MNISDHERMMERIEAILARIEKAERWYDSIPGSGHKSDAPVTINARDARMIINLALDAAIQKVLKND